MEQLIADYEQDLVKTGRLQKITGGLKKVIGKFMKGLLPAEQSQYQYDQEPSENSDLSQYDRQILEISTRNTADIN